MVLLRSTYSVLVEDCQEIESLRRSSDTPGLRRAYVRALYALSEGVAAQMKRLVLDSLIGLYGARQELGFKEEEFARLYPAVVAKFGFAPQELRWLCGVGRARAHNRFRLAAACYSKLHGEPFSLSCDDCWDGVMELRSRIMRPAHAGELEITRGEWAGVEQARDGMIADIGRLFAMYEEKQAERARVARELFRDKLDIPFGE